MRYIPNTHDDCAALVKQMGFASFDDLLAPLPDSIRLKRPLSLPRSLSEMELLAHLRELSGRNRHLGDGPSFLGAGAYHHYIPSIVQHLIGRAEFYTSYTPYQPEISQGTLQAIYEYQSLICMLTGAEVSNASLYEGASATAEAVAMALRVNGRSRIVLARTLHPEYRLVTRTYHEEPPHEIVEVGHGPDGRVDLTALRELVDEEASVVAVQSPNFLGVVEDVAACAQVAQQNGALLAVLVAEPISLGILKPPAQQGADVVAGEAQPLGIPLSYGGPYLGFFATRREFLREMPGRLAGATEDTEGRRGYVLTFATREQHIRRERATSNICTNQGLCALAAAVFMCTYGKEGLRELALHNLSKAQYAREALRRAGLTLPLSGPTFNEFVVRVRGTAAEANERLLEEGIIGGYDLSEHYPELGPALLLCVTEQNSREGIDRAVAALRR